MTNLAVPQISSSRECTFCSVQRHKKGILDSISASTPTNRKTARWWERKSTVKVGDIINLNMKLPKKQGTGRVVQEEGY